MKSEIKAIIFDVGGVLALGKENLKPCHQRLHHIGVHQYISSKLKISLDQWFDAIDTIYALAIEGKISESKLMNTMAKNTKTTTQKLRKIVIKAYKRKFKQNKQLFKQVFKLKQIGYKIAILSDQWHLSKEALMSDKRYRRFNPIVVSCDVGIRKPNPKIYKLILKKLKLKPSECVFIDNQKWNAEPARKLGIKTILFKNNKQLFKHPVWKRLFK
ncbi:MAG: HAD-IA family hydrolase [Nanoarchaeota archaeon]|nr:HAD-IA family hydrolase [Nanoarchaeota archaeon]